MPNPEIKPVIGPLPHFPKTVRTAVYARVSKLSKISYTSIESQINGLIRFAQEYPRISTQGIYVDIGSGKNLKSRKQMNRLLDDCMAGEYDLILTKSISRFGRNIVDVLSICRTLKEKAIGVYFFNENIYSLSSEGELALAMYSQAAEIDSYNKSENIKWGIDKSARQASSPIYSRSCFGYSKDETGGLIINESEAKTVKMIFDLYLEGRGTKFIQDKLQELHIPSPHGSKLWQRSTIDSILRNEKYTGDVLIYKTIIGDFPTSKRIVNNDIRSKLLNSGHHMPIISHELFDKVQEEIAKRKRKKANNGLHNH